MKKLEWKTEQRKVKDLVPLAINPRKISPEKQAKLLASLEKFNLAEIPCVNTDGTIIGGNQRVELLAMAGRGDEAIDVRMPNRKLTEKEVKEYAIISNTHAGEFDFDILEMEFKDVDIGDFDIAGLDVWRLKKEAAETGEDNFEAPAGGLPTDIVIGDVFDIGLHRLLCGDSTNADNVSRLMDGKCPILMVTDPPYGVKYDPTWRHRAGISNSRRQGKVTNDDNARWLAAYLNFKGDVLYVWCASLRSAEVHQDIIDAGFIPDYLIIWNKQQATFGRGDYHWKHEPCWYGHRKGQKHNWGGGRKQTTVWDITTILQSKKAGDEANIHGTQKPVECMARPIRNNSAVGDSVYDPFLGSGTTMVAAHQLGRRCFGIEISPQYCQVIIDRMRKFDPEIKITKNGELWTTPKTS